MRPHPVDTARVLWTIGNIIQLSQSKLMLIPDKTWQKIDELKLSLLLGVTMSLTLDLPNFFLRIIKSFVSFCQAGRVE